MVNAQIKKKKKAARRPAPRRNNRSRAPDRTMVQLSSCVKDYALALEDGFNAKRLGAAPCVPDSMVTRSHKSSIFFRGTFETNSTADGWIAMNPRNPVSDVAFAQATTSASVGTSSTVMGSYTLQDPLSWQSPYLNAEFGVGAIFKQFRTVSCTIRIRYIGTELNKGGSMFPFMNPDQQNMYLVTPTQLLQFQDAESVPVTQDWTYLSWHPTRATDFEYTGAVGTDYPLVIYVHSAAAFQPFEVEIISYLEVVGSALPGLTPSHSDPVGFGATLEVIANRQDHRKPSGVLRRIADAISTTASYVKSNSSSLGQIARGGFEISRAIAAA
jgi:hypothetical protein